MSHKQDRMLATVFAEPLSGNIHWRDVESLLRHLGASISSSHGARMHMILNGVEGSLHRPHHTGVCSKQDIRHLRDFLEAAGVAPAGRAAGTATEPDPQSSDGSGSGA
ncbi:MAG: type II toxin-antitoxin system HicA family toxin [Pseudomonadota bacterium]